MGHIICSSPSLTMLRTNSGNRFTLVLALGVILAAASAEEYSGLGELESGFISDLLLVGDESATEDESAADLNVEDALEEDAKRRFGGGLMTSGSFKMMTSGGLHHAGR